LIDPVLFCEAAQLLLSLKPLQGGESFIVPRSKAAELFIRRRVVNVHHSVEGQAPNTVVISLNAKGDTVARYMFETMNAFLR
jgi:hypothetical protein